jgi:hypothetical protein
LRKVNPLDVPMLLMAAMSDLDLLTNVSNYANGISVQIAHSVCYEPAATA